MSVVTALKQNLHTNADGKSNQLIWQTCEKELFATIIPINFHFLDFTLHSL
jgi:hypothetical protein